MNTQVWPQCLKILESELTAAAFAAWIQPLSAEFGEGENDLYISAPNQTICDWVQENYQQHIKGVLEKQGFSSLNLAFTVKGHKPLSPASIPAAASPATAGQRNNIINPAYTFKNFIAGKSNQMAFSAARIVPQFCGAAQHNPLVIHGGVGLGKTHLMHAIANAFVEQGRSARIVCCTAEEFVNDMVTSLRYKAASDFQKHYRRAEVLLIDDIQFFVGKEKSQEEVFYAIDRVHESRGQVVVTCDAPASEIKGLAPRLRSRLSMGLSVLVEAPDMETRMAILLQKAEECGARLPPEGARYIAEQFHTNVRELQGALNRVIAASRFADQKEIGLSVIRSALADAVHARARRVGLQDIKKRVADYFGVRVHALDSKSRTRSIARPRQIAMALARELTKYSLPEIGKAFGDRDHTTVMHACRAVQKYRDKDKATEQDYLSLLGSLRH